MYLDKLFFFLTGEKNYTTIKAKKDLIFVVKSLSNRVQKLELFVGEYESLHTVADAMIQLVDSPHVVLLQGDLGAGKTTFVKKCCELLGCEDNVSSPTFAIVQEYHTPKLKPPFIYHLDTYRIQYPSEIIESGLNDLLVSGVWTFVEWPEILKPWWPEHRIEVNIEILHDNSRKFVFLVI